MYNPDYDTTVTITTEIVRHNTDHCEGIDWDYPFDRNVDLLKQIELNLQQGKEVLVSNYGGMPRIWHKVIGLCMASCWPYWKPRPTVLVECSLGSVEWYDYASLTGVKCELDA